MTPDDITRIKRAVDHLPTVADQFSSSFYATLFEIDPEARSLFPDDMGQQRAKLFKELQALVTVGVDLAADGATFTSRAHALGRRHDDYGANPGHYELVGQALLTALGEFVPGWGPEDRSAWTRLYGLMAQTMMEGRSVSAG
jgi:nitric oxide dioxygenase